MLGSKKPAKDEAPPPDTVVTPVTAKPKVSMDGISTSPPKQVSVLMKVDGGLNGKCWRAGDTVMLDPEAADLYLAKRHAVKA